MPSLLEIVSVLKLRGFIMSDGNVHMCPLFPDQPCPQGKEAADACAVRVNGDYDPVTNFKDLLVMHCAIHKSNQNKEEK